MFSKKSCKSLLGRRKLSNYILCLWCFISKDGRSRTDMFLHMCNLSAPVLGLTILSWLNWADGSSKFGFVLLSHVRVYAALLVFDLNIITLSCYYLGGFVEHQLLVKFTLRFKYITLFETCSIFLLFPSFNVQICPLKCLPIFLDWWAKINPQILL